MVSPGNSSSTGASLEVWEMAWNKPVLAGCACVAGRQMYFLSSDRHEGLKRSPAFGENHGSGLEMVVNFREAKYTNSAGSARASGPSRTTGNLGTTPP
jgi:hypothetical protein